MRTAGDVTAGDAGPEEPLGPLAGAPLAGGGHRGGSARRLPGSRAVIGALLIALAALGVIVAISDAGAGPSTRFVVAARNLPPGHVLTAGDVTTVALDLPDSLAGRAFRNPASLAGATVLAPLGEGELVQVGSLVRTGGEDRRREMSFSVEADLALGGSLVPGEVIDILATFGSGPDADTRAVVTGAAVVGIADAGTGMGGRFTVITVALQDEADVIALGHAVRDGKVTVVRATGAPAWSDPGEQRR